MPIPTIIGDLSSTAALNSPSGSDALNTTDDYLRAVQGIVKTVYDTQTTTNSAVTTSLSLKANLASPTFTGTPTLPTGSIGVTQAAGNSTTALATTAFVTTADNLKANLASPAFTGTPSLPTGTTGITQTAGDNSTKLATTAYVDRGSTRFTSTGNATTAGSSLTLAHGLGAKPYRIITSIVCTAGDAGYSIGDEIIMPPVILFTSVSYGFVLWVDATNINIRFATTSLFAANKGTGSATGLNNASWQLSVRAEL